MRILHFRQFSSWSCHKIGGRNCLLFTAKPRIKVTTLSPSLTTLTLYHCYPKYQQTSVFSTNWNDHKMKTSALHYKSTCRYKLNEWEPTCIILYTTLSTVVLAVAAFSTWSLHWSNARYLLHYVANFWCCPVSRAMSNQKKIS